MLFLTGIAFCMYLLISGNGAKKREDLYLCILTPINCSYKMKRINLSYLAVNSVQREIFLLQRVAALETISRHLQPVIQTTLIRSQIVS